MKRNMDRYRDLGPEWRVERMAILPGLLARSSRR
jgi:hypothetical protein